MKRMLVIVLCLVLAMTAAVPAEAMLYPEDEPTNAPDAQAEVLTPTPMPTKLPLSDDESDSGEDGAYSVAAMPTPSPTEPQNSPTPTPMPGLSPDAAPTEEPMPLGKDDLTVREALAVQNAAHEEAFAQAALSGSKYSDFKFDSVRFLQGIYTSASLYVQLPDYITPTGAVLRLSYTASNLVLENVSSLTFYMNGVGFASEAVRPSMDQSAEIRYISVPLELFKEGYNLLEIGAYLRLTDDEEGCSDDYNGANWVKINDESCLRVAYNETENKNSLALFPYPFLSLDDVSGSNCCIAVSNAAAEDELTAALTLMADMGTNVASESELELNRIGKTKRKNVIYFGMEQNTPGELLRLLDATVPNTGALVKRVSANGKQYLLVISNEEDALLEAARYLADATRVEQTVSDTIHISVGEAQTFIDARRSSGLALEGKYTIKDVLGHGASFTGPFHQAMTINLPLSQDYALSSDGRFTFNIRYSENLNFDRSIMTVYWGSDIPLYSRKLTAEGAAGDMVSFAVPADAAGTVSNHMVIAFDLEIEDMDCTPRQLDMPWAYVAENSSLYLPQDTASVRVLSNLPMPFQRSSMFDDVLVVLPDDASETELLLSGRVMNMLGIGSDPYGSMKAIPASKFGEEYYDNHIVVVGTALDNALIRRMNSSLHFKFTADGKAVLSNDKLVLDGTYATMVGTMQLLASPYKPDRSVLVVSAPEDIGLEALIDRLSLAAKRWSLGGEAVLVDSRGKITSYQFTLAAAKEADENKPSFSSVIMENKEPMMMLVIGMGCMLLVLLTAIFILLRARKNKRSE